MTAGEGTIRVYVRCRDCLSVACVEVARPTLEEIRKPDADAPRYRWESYYQARSRNASRLDAAASAFQAMCGLCDGKIEVMGRVKNSGTVVTASHVIPACDSRCTGATGPKCDCPCGGVNHGTGAVVRVEQTATTPRVIMRDRAKARQIAVEWRAELERVAATRPGRLAALSIAGTWLSPSDYNVAQQCRSIVSNAYSLRTHKGRMAALQKITEAGIAN